MELSGLLEFSSRLFATQSAFDYLDTHLATLCASGTGIILTGDFNVHHKAWLGSSKTSKAGEELEDLCSSYGLSQHVHFPTRGCNPLDLVISDCPTPVSVTVHPPLGRSDHNVIIADFSRYSPHHQPKTARTVWRYHQADWGRFRHYLKEFNWAEVIQDDAEEACSELSAVIRKGMNQFIPSKELWTNSSNPSWWTPECSQVVALKEKTLETLEAQSL